jgi:general secretion pathway protein D
VEEFYGQVPGYDVPIDFGRKPGPLAKMNQIVMREEMKIENGGPGLPGEQVFSPGQLGPGQPRQPQTGPSSPADIGRDLLQSAPPPAPAPQVGPPEPGPPPGLQEGAPAAPAQGAPQTAPPSGTAQPQQQTTPPPQPHPNDERLEVQPR